MPKTSPLAGDRQPAVLFVDDDQFGTRSHVLALKDAGYQVSFANTTAKALELIKRSKFEVAVVDIMMPPGPEFDPIDTAGGFLTGLALARHLREKIPNIKIVGLSIADHPDVENWFNSQDSAFFLSKHDCLPSDLVECVYELLQNRRKAPRIFIVHGRNWQRALELKNFIQNTLHLGESIILAEQPSKGQTLIEKFEEYANRIDLAFVVLTPDDLGSLAKSPDHRKRGRQNVIFELGYFLGRLGRKSGKVILLQNGTLEIPSNISGVVHIDISHGIEAAGEEIRRELSTWL